MIKQSNDICVDIPGGMFNYRVGAIILHNGYLLMAKDNNNPIYYTVGGRVQFRESSRDAVVRETFEETGVQLTIDRLVVIHENFFTWEPEDKPFHEICFYYLMKPHNGLDKIQKSFTEYNIEMGLYWLPVDKLSQYPMYPVFLPEEVKNPSPVVKQITTQDDVII